MAARPGPWWYSNAPLWGIFIVLLIGLLFGWNLLDN
jgi:hypothetical protein